MIHINMEEGDIIQIDGEKNSIRLFCDDEGYISHLDD